MSWEPWKQAIVASSSSDLPNIQKNITKTIHPNLDERTSNHLRYMLKLFDEGIKELEAADERKST